MEGSRCDAIHQTVFECTIRANARPTPEAENESIDIVSLIVMIFVEKLKIKSSHFWFFFVLYQLLRDPLNDDAMVVTDCTCKPYRLDPNVVS